ncbi:serine/threonine-protein kinase [Polyangium sp. y55x31]|uniref:serine/threonine-protein kinase n=1 Tax=Polyangium sp. y55x31 TaxID=3042688 RepID=UPI00248261B3|nr:serine/threonine-protein kinase [Polyangium sp. y55x31]MDI1481605.1 protein kinase [Polyangium sp. y55x31]
MAPKSKTLPAGTLVARRFVVRSLAGRGGMGEVYRAADQETGEEVALKLLHADATSLDTERFAREARILSEIRHPRVVSYVAHGQSEDGRHFLAMQWLEGEDLAKRLARGPLSTREALLLLRRITEGLAALHARRVVHRDLKPSNVLLRGGDIDQATIVDLGIARSMGPATGITATGRSIGTPEYMSPEQVGSEQPIGPASDMFSLGCILFECLAGRPPFVAPDPVLVMSKILSEDPPELLPLRPGVPPPVAALVQSLLQKDPDRRPASASSLLEELPALLEIGARRGAFSPSVARDVPELLSVLVLAPPAGTSREELARILLRNGAFSHGSRPEGWFVTAFARFGGDATDQAAAAARAALAAKAALPEATIAIATGPGFVSGEQPVGEAVDRAVEALREEDAPRGVVIVDVVTAGLVGGRFETTREGGRILLTGGGTARDEARSPLGKTMPFVGRKRELDLLLRAFEAAREEPQPRAVVVVAPAGMGKSRLLQELRARLEAREEDVLFLVGRSEPHGATAYAMLADALRGHGPRELSTTSERRAMTGFVDGRVARAQIERTFLEYLRGACATRPVVLALEDVHHADARSVRLVERALAELSDQPLFVLALARPDVEDVYPRLWGDRAERMVLSPLVRRDAEELARAALGPEESDAVVERIATRAAGNPLFVEELARAARDAGEEGERPATLLAILQARLGRLGPDARRALVAASIFGTRFWRGGVLALMDREGHGAFVDQALGALVRAEFLEKQRTSRLAGDVEYTFRHVLVREAAYGLLGEEELALGHARAAAFLEAAGEHEADVLAEHWQRGGDPARARVLHVRAAREAFERNDLAGTRAHAAKAEELGAEGAELGLVRGMACCILYWNKAWAEACLMGIEALPLLPKGSTWHCRVLGLVCTLTGLGVYAEAFPAYLDELLALTPDLEAQGAYAECLGRLLCLLAMRLDRGESHKALHRMRETLERAGAVDPSAHGWARLAAYEYGRTTTNEPLALLEIIEDATRAFEAAGDARMRALCMARVGEALGALGALHEAEAQFAEAEAQAAALDDALTKTGVRILRATFLAEQTTKEALAEARALAEALVAEPGIGPFDAGIAWGIAARISLAEGDAARALAEVDRGLELVDRMGLRRLSLTATRMRALSRVGRVAEAEALARAALAEMRAAGGLGAGEVDLRMAAAEALRAAGDVDAFEGELRAALRLLGRELADVRDPEGQTRLLHDVPANAEAARLAREQFGESAVLTLLAS